LNGRELDFFLIGGKGQGILLLNEVLLSGIKRGAGLTHG
jgi:hypothetical protein